MTSLAVDDRELSGPPVQRGRCRRGCRSDAHLLRGEARTVPLMRVLRRSCRPTRVGACRPAEADRRDARVRFWPIWSGESTGNPRARQASTPRMRLPTCDGAFTSTSGRRIADALRVEERVGGDAGGGSRSRVPSRAPGSVRRKRTAVTGRGAPQPEPSRWVSVADGDGPRAEGEVRRAEL